MLRSAKPVQTLEDRRAYIPPHIENAMAEHVQQSMPAHLQKYKGGNTFIPQHTQNEMTQHLENALPSHMKQYAGAYMQQRVVEPSLARRGSVPAPVPPPDPSSAAPHAPVIQPQTPGQNPPVSGPQASYAQPTDQNQSPDQSYSFITNPQKPPKQSRLSGLGSASLPVRIGIIAGGLLVLLVIFIVLRGLLSNSPSLTSFVTITQEQQELIHLATNASQQQGLSAGNQDLAATMQASLGTSQAETIKYMTANGKKINQKQLNLKISATADTQLTDAVASATYNQTFHEIVQAKLKAYNSTLSSTYDQTSGKNGRALLKDSYRQAQLFQTQLNETPN